MLGKLFFRHVVGSAAPVGNVGLEMACLVEGDAGFRNRLTLGQRFLVAQVSKIDEILNCIENNIDGMFGVAGHVAWFLFSILKHLWQDMAMHGLKVIKDLTDCATERVGGLIANRCKMRGSGRLSDSLGKRFFNSLNFSEETELLLVSLPCACKGASCHL